MRDYFQIVLSSKSDLLSEFATSQLSMSSSYWDTVLDKSSGARPSGTNGSLTCPTCHRTFSSTQLYEDHAHNCERQPGPSERSYICEICQNSFRKRSNLVKHTKLVHLGERNFACTEPSCNKVFGQKSNLNSHVKAVHRGEKPFKCTEQGCEKRFSQKSGLNAHVKTVHRGERPFVCECGSPFGHRGDVSHMSLVFLFWHSGFRSSYSTFISNPEHNFWLHIFSLLFIL